MRVGIFAKTFPGSDPAAVLGAARETGYDCVQWNWSCAGLEPLPERVPTRALEAVRGALASTGVEIVAVSGTFNMIHPDAAVRERGLRGLDEVARRARAIGAGLVTLCTGTRDPDDRWAAHPDNASSDAWEDFTAALREALRIAARHGVRLGIEPELANVVDGAARASRALEETRAALGEAAAARLRIVLDAANLAERGDAAARRAGIEVAIDALAPYVEIAHAKDRRADGTFASVGDGAIDFAHYLDRLARAGFDGPLIAHGLAAEDAPRVARRLRSLVDAHRP